MMTAIFVPRRSPVLVSLRKSGHGIDLNIWNSGWNRTCGGSRLPAVKISSSVTLNRHENRLTAKAIALDRARISINDGITMNIVLPNARLMLPCDHALR